MLIPELVRVLDLEPGSHPRGKPWLSAASSLVCLGQHAYVVADDEQHLAHFTLAPQASPASRPIRLLRLFPGTLPKDKGKRKKAKPDLESLVLLPAFDLYPHGALLALGSGSRANRCRGVLLALDGSGKVSGPALAIGLDALYAPLRAGFGALNIEGAFVAGQELHLLQRGNKASRTSARISYDWNAFAAWLLGDTMQAPLATRVQHLELGSVDGVPLTPTDAAALADGNWVFCAVAEDTGDPYTDGACIASALGIIDRSGHLTQLEHLHGNPKVEGIALEPGCAAGSSELRLLLVTDADDPEQAAQLLGVTLRRNIV